MILISAGFDLLLEKRHDRAARADDVAVTNYGESRLVSAYEVVGGDEQFVRGEFRAITVARSELESASRSSNLEVVFTQSVCESVFTRPIC